MPGLDKANAFASAGNSFQRKVAKAIDNGASRRDLLPKQPGQTKIKPGEIILNKDHVLNI